MRDKVRSNNLKVLIICPSSTYNSIDRKALSDCQFLRDIGGNPTLYCLRGSFLEKEAEKLSLPRILFRGVRYKALFPFSYLLDIRDVLKEDWDIVHCYHLNSFWGVALWLLSKPRIPLFISFNQFFGTDQPNRFFLWLLKRVDNVFTFTQSTASRFSSHYNFPLRKIKVTGIGVDSFIGEKSVSPGKKIGVFLNHESETDNLRSILYLINDLERELNSNIKLKVYTFKPIKDFYDYTNIQRMIKEQTLESKVDFFMDNPLNDALKSLDVVVSLSFAEPISDFEIKSFLSHIPIILPRTAARKELSINLDIANTYSFQDTRALREALIDIFKNKDKYLAGIESSQDELLELHELENYGLRIHSSYELAVQKRVRVFDS